jgi:DNA-binding IscR family transcriptional regulator
VKGPNGGFYITDEQRQLPVREVLNALGEDAVLQKCVLGLKECSEINPCPMHARYKTIKLQLIQLFENKTINSLATELNNGNAFIKNPKRIKRK